jgi:hypothetical protein
MARLGKGAIALGVSLEAAIGGAGVRVRWMPQAITPMPIVLKLANQIAFTQFPTNQFVTT